MSHPRPFRVYKRVLAHHRYVGCYATYEAAAREARIVGGYVSVRTLPHTSDQTAIVVTAAAASFPLSQTLTSEAHHDE